jgi:predicted kinase
MLRLDHTDVAFHEQLQSVLYRHGLMMLRHGVSLILEDVLWTSAERTEKFAGARGCGASIELHVFDVPVQTLWAQLDQRNQQAAPEANPITQEQLQEVWNLFQAHHPRSWQPWMSGLSTRAAQNKQLLWHRHLRPAAACRPHLQEPS